MRVNEWKAIQTISAKAYSKAVQEICGEWAHEIVIQFDGAGGHGVGRGAEETELEEELNDWGSKVQYKMKDGLIQLSNYPFFFASSQRSHPT